MLKKSTSYLSGSVEGTSCWIAFCKTSRLFRTKRSCPIWKHLFPLEFPRINHPGRASTVSLCLGAFRCRIFGFSDGVQVQEALVLVW